MNMYKIYRLKYVIKLFTLRTMVPIGRHKALAILRREAGRRKEEGYETDISNRMGGQGHRRDKERQGRAAYCTLYKYPPAYQGRLPVASTTTSKQSINTF